jgi:hypothetical protein
MPKRAWAWWAVVLSGGASLLQMGCRNSFISEMDLLTSPEALSSLFFVPRSEFLSLFRFFWGF